jgi:hypothetical protein
MAVTPGRVNASGLMVNNADSRQILASVINHSLKRLLPSLIGNPVDLQSRDATILPGFLNGGRVDAEFKYRHCLLHSFRQHAAIFPLQLILDPLDEALDFSLRCYRQRFRLKKTKSVVALVFNSLQSLQKFVACHSSSQYPINERYHLFMPWYSRLSTKDDPFEVVISRKTEYCYRSLLGCWCKKSRLKRF